MILSYKELEKRDKELKKKLKARNKASSIIEDARARYIKQKTRAKSKAAATERDAVLNSARFDALKDYDRREDIIEAYGCDIISSSELDRLEDLWDERELIRNHVDDTGLYKDEVTEVLHEAWLAIQDLYEDEVDQLRYDLDRYMEA